jgi:shikimate dehydrogenase
MNYKFGLTGFPLSHSHSPAIHHAALAALGLAGKYRLYPVDPRQLEAGLGKLVARLRAGDLHGLNVTIPHKQAILSWLDELTPAARAIGAANTLFLQGNHLRGDNTDAQGFWDALAPHLPETGVAPLALVLGAGGSARAVVYALLAHGWPVIVCARRLAQAETLCQDISAGAAETGAALKARAAAWDTSLTGAWMAEHAPGLVVNTTPLGMHPHPDRSPWPARLPFPPGAVVCDLVYNPSQTCLLSQAHGAGLTAINGLAMLVEQAALALECWLGRPVPRQPMYAAAQEAAHTTYSNPGKENNQTK